MKIEEVPGRAFLDTSSLNFILEYGEYIFDALKPANNFDRLRITKRISNNFSSNKKILFVLNLEKF